MSKSAVSSLHEILQNHEFVELQERYRTLMDLLPDAIAIHQGGLIVYVNQAGLEMLRYQSIDEVVGRPVLSFVHPNSIYLVKERVGDLVDGSGKAPRIEERFVRMDGSVVDVEVAASRCQLNGAPAVLVALRDITERKVAERLLHQSEARFRRLAEYARDIVFRIRIHPERVFEYVSPSVLAVTGYEVTDFYLNPELGSLLVHPEDRHAFLEAELSEEAMRKPLNVRWIRKDGAIIWVEYRNVPVYDGEKRLVAVEGIIRDVSERKEAEDGLRMALGEKEILLKEIHHRVKNNMQVIASLLSLEAQHVADKRDMRLFEESQHRVRSISLVHERLYNSHSLARIDFSSYLTILSDQLKAMYQRHSVAVEINVNGVELGIDQAIPCGLIVNELITNALKYAFPADRKGMIRIDAGTEAGSRIRICVADNGIGMPESINPNASVTLGLQLIILLSQQLGAEVRFERTRGTTCILSFPSRPALS